MVPVEMAGVPRCTLVTAAGHDDEGTSVSATATATVTYTGVAPAIQVVKSATPTTVSEGGVGNQTVTYTYAVTNASPASTDPLTLVSLIDDNGTPGNTSDDVNLLTAGTFVGGDANNNGLIDKGETWTFTYTTTVPVGNAGATRTNLVTAAG